MESWRLWCRMCARKPSHESDEKFLSLSDSANEFTELVHRCFPYTISESLAISPTKICPDCSEFLTKIKSFEEVCLKSDKLFKEIIAAGSLKSEENLLSIRSCYFSDNEEDDVPLGRITRNKVPAKRGRKSKVLSEQKKPIQRKRKICENDLEVAIDKFVEVEMKKEDSESDREFVASPDVNCFDNFEEDSAERNSLNNTEGNKIEEEPDKDTKIKRIKGSNLRDPVKCPRCDKLLKHSKCLAMHMKMVHRDPSLKFDCDQCAKNFSTEKRLEHHKRIHLPKEERQRYPCPYCDNMFMSRNGVALHIQTIHTQEKPFVCEECGKPFTTNHALKEHKVAHTDERPFQCLQCPKRFKNPQALKLHTDIHDGTEYICPICGQRLNTKKTLNRHMVVHSDVKKYKCQYCGNEYKRAKALKDHLILHTGLHPYSCPFCERTFVNGSNFRSHKLKMHPEELAALAASGLEEQPVNLPKLHQLQPRQQKSVN